MYAGSAHWVHGHAANWCADHLGMPRSRGRQHSLRISGWGDPSRVRRHARLSGQACPGSSRAGSLAHGGRLRSRRRWRWCGHGDVGPRSDESRDGHRHRDDGLGADGVHHRTGAEQADWLRCLSGNRHHRHHASDYEAQLSRDARRRHHAGDEGSVRSGQVRPAWSGAR